MISLICLFIYIYRFMRKEIGELVPIKLIKRIIRNYGKGRKLFINTTDTKNLNN